MSLKRAAACVKKHKNFLITSHLNLEGDALGAELAFYRLLKKMGKGARIINKDTLPYEYEFLPGKNLLGKFSKGAKFGGFDCFTALDCSDLGRAGAVGRINTAGKTVLNIDHHISNVRFGDINWVDAKASSCSEMIYRLYKQLRVPLDRQAALYLYVGILTDTGSFRYTNTSGFTHKAASELLKFDLNAAQIYNHIYASTPFEDMRVIIDILCGLRLEPGGKIAWAQVKSAMLKNKKPRVDLTDRVMTFARAIKGVEVAVLFREAPGVANEVRVNFRSRGKVDVNRIAQGFSGGGHKTASGATIKGSLEQARKKVLAKIREHLSS